MSLAKAMLSRVFSRGSDDPLAAVDFDADHIGVYEVFARDVVDNYDWGQRTVSDFERRPPATNGSGHLRSDAFDEVEDQIDDVDDHRGEVVATIVIDVDEWSYRYRMEVDR